MERKKTDFKDVYVITEEIDMFFRKKNKPTVVKSTKQLKEALERKDPDIEVQGQLAKK